MTRASTSNRRRVRSSGGTLIATLAFLGFASATAIAAPAGKMGPTNASAPQNAVAPNAPFHTGGHIAELKAYVGHPFVVWQVTTWCPSCRAGLETFARHQAQIDKSDVTIIVLRDYKNGGYHPSASMHNFVDQVSPKLLNDPHFVIGEDTKALFDLYNPHHYIDVYQVIASDGRIAVDSSTPSTTFGKIEDFIKPKTGP